MVFLFRSEFQLWRGRDVDLSLITCIRAHAIAKPASRQSQSIARVFDETWEVISDGRYPELAPDLLELDELVVGTWTYGPVPMPSLSELLKPARSQR
jgi:hypothetical protein